MHRPRTSHRITAIVLLLTLCSTLLLIPTSQAQTSAPAMDKVSPDLRQLIQSGHGDTKVRVIVQTKSTPSAGGLLGLVGGLVVKVLLTLNLQIMDIQANSADAIAADPDVT